MAIEVRHDAHTDQSDPWRRWLDSLEVDENDFRWVHDAEIDALYITLGEPTRSTTVHGDEGIGVRVDERTGEVVGAHIDAWERRFLKRFPDVQTAWNYLAHARQEGFPPSAAEDARKRFVRTLARVVNDVCGGMDLNG